MKRLLCLILGLAGLLPASELTDALIEKQWRVARQLIATGKTLDEPDCYDQSPLWLVASEYHCPDGDLAYDLMNRMLAHGANPNCVDKRGLSVMTEVAMHGNVTRVKRLLGLLLEFGGDPSPSIEGGTFSTPLHHAAHRAVASDEWLEVVHLLMANGADPHSKSGTLEKTPFEWLAQEAGWKVMRGFPYESASIPVDTKESKRLFEVGIDRYLEVASAMQR